jgi:3-hydroxybutyryl-CoA dehydratase
MEARTYTYTQELIDRFAQFSGDFNPIHVNEEYAKTTPFKGTIAHGALIEVFVSAELASKYPGCIITEKNKVRFRKPFRPGDEVEIVLTKHAAVDDYWWIENAEARVNGEAYFTAHYVLRTRKPKEAK